MTIERTYPRRGLHGELVHEIGVRILRGELKPGDSLPTEEDLSGELGVSRTVLREAVKVLAAKGLVEARPKTGTRVRPRAEWNLIDPDVLMWRLEARPRKRFFQDIIELRRIIEPEAARLAAARATEAEIDELAATFEEMEAAVEDADAYLQPDLRFHAIILEACHNELLQQVGLMLRAVFRALFIHTSANRAQALPLHGAMVDAIRARDGLAAVRTTQALIDDTAATLDRIRF
jgi:DNA-binding FadR family transcriptional regulator